MRVCTKKLLPIVAACFLVVFTTGMVQAAPAIGLDADTDLVCTSPDGPDMGRWALVEDIGTTYSFDLFFTDFGDIVSFGCVFCVKDSMKITNWSWAYGATGDSPWTGEAFKSGAATLSFITLDLSGYPNAGCFMAQATDWTMGAPLSTTTPLVMGTFTYDVAAEGAIDWILDESSSALTGAPDYETIYGEEFCADKDSESATEHQSWGAIKQMFR